jgi:hypothetical protein
MLNNHLGYDAAYDAAYDASYVACKSLSGPTPLFYSIYSVPTATGGSDTGSSCTGRTWGND